MMMKATTKTSVATTTFLLLLLLANAFPSLVVALRGDVEIREFGRLRTSTSDMDDFAYGRALEIDNTVDVLGQEDWFALGMSMSMSMSMSMATDPPTPVPTPTRAPVGFPASTIVPSESPSEGPTKALSGVPTLVPTASFSDIPSDIPSLEPSLATSAVASEGAMSSFPSSSTAPGECGTPPIFTCSEAGLGVAGPSSDETTIVEISVSYRIETGAPFVEYQESLEYQIMLAAVTGALQCDENFSPIDTGVNTTPFSCIDVLTAFTGEQCESQSTNNCAVLNTSFEVVFEGLVDPVQVSNAFIAIENLMNSGELADSIDVIDQAEYLAPLPQITPGLAVPEGNPAEVQAVDTARSGGYRVQTCFTMGLVAATMLFGRF